MSRLEDIVGNVVYREFGSVLAHDPHDPERFWGGATASIVRAIENAAGGPDHIVVVKNSAWTIQHPIAERFEDSLFSCRFTQAMDAVAISIHQSEGNGRYRVWLDAGVFLWERVDHA